MDAEALIGDLAVEPEPPPDASAAAKPESEQKPPFPPPAGVPTQQGPEGIRFDFNQGARILLPTRTEGKWRVRLRDLDTGNILFQSENQGALVRSSKRFFVRFSLEVWELDETGTPTAVLSHEYDARDRDVLIQFPIGTLGDILGSFPYAARFGEVHRCRLTCAMSGLIIPLLRDAYPAIRFVTREELTEQGSPSAAARPIVSACSSTTRNPSMSRPISVMSGRTAGRLHPGGRSGRGTAAPGIGGRRAADRRTRCLRRRARLGVVNWLVGWVKPLICATGFPAAQPSRDSPLLRPMNAAV